MAVTQDVVTWFWTNNDDGRWRCLFTDRWSNILAQFLGVWFTLMLPRLVKLILHVMDLAARYNNAIPQPQLQMHRLNASYNTRTSIEHATWRSLKDAIHDCWLLLPPRIQLQGGPVTSHDILKRALRNLFWFIMLLIIFAGFLTGGVLLANVQIDSVALSRSPKCGVYHPPSHDDDEAYAKVVTPYEYQMQVDSASYAEKCYGVASNSKSCNAFYQQDIEYKITHNIPCPFHDDLCYGGANSAFSISTGPTPARAAGINVDRRYEFMREATFTPLNMNETFITHSNVDGIDTFEYRYSPSEHSDGSPASNMTWRTFTHRDFWGQVPSYTLSVITHSTSFARNSVFRPMPELTTSTGSILTLLFITSKRIYYTEPSRDPIFPTHDIPEDLPDTTANYYMYRDWFARPLAVVDTIKWRDLDDGLEWHDWHEEPSADKEGGLWLLWHSLQNSFSYQSISRRSAAGLVATSRLTGFISLPLDYEHWKTESLSMFKATLARIQFDAHSISRGLPSAYGYRKDPDSHPRLCDNTYMFQVEGWTNIGASWWWGFFIASGIIIVLAIPFHDDPEALLYETICCGHSEFVSHLIVRFIVGILEFVRESIWIVAETVECYIAWPIARVTGAIWDAIKR